MTHKTQDVMNLFRNPRQRYWAYVGGWVFCIYSTLSIVRPICEFLKATLPFALFVNAVLIGILLAIILVFLKKIGLRKASSYVLLFIVLCAYAYGLIVIVHPEEKIHFLEYGFLSFLIFRALRLDWGPPWVYGGAFILTSLVGWGDEGIQHLLPNRYYQLQDVMLNSISGLLGLLLVYIARREKQTYVQ